FEAVRRIRQTHSDLSLAAFKALVREQFFMLLIDSDAALAAIPAMIPAEAENRLEAFDLIKQVLSARGGFSAEDHGRIERVARLFGVGERTSAAPDLGGGTPFRPEARAS